MVSIDDYKINEHSHRFAAWLSSRAASSSPVQRFKVSQGKKLLEGIGFTEKLTIKKLPQPSQFDREHEEWREGIVEGGRELELNISHGIAAKLINTYLKSRFISENTVADDIVGVIHPPIDRQLLIGLAREDFAGLGKEWRKYRDKGWSNYGPEDYEDVISLIRKALDGKPLWMIEYYWKGYQS